LGIVFSVVIPTYNRPVALRNCLEALAQQQYSRDAFEVIVVNDGGSECLAELEQLFQDRLNCTMLHQLRSGPATARNYGALRARGRYLAFTDDDCRPSPGWLTRLEQSLVMNPDSLAGGRVLNAVKGRRCSAASQHLLDFLYAFYTEQGRPRFFASNNFALSASGFRVLGGFDESFPLAAAEDREFCARWSQQGGSMVYAPAAVVRHFHALNISGFIRQHFNYGRGAYLFHRRCASSGRGGVRLEPLSFYLRLLSCPFTVRAGNMGTRLHISSLLLLSQVVNIFGYCCEKARKNSPEFRAIQTVSPRLGSE
jgi:glycosyltransferase involved in cell wall biosynthesis